MASGFSVGYINFTIFLLLLSGMLILRIDIKGYEIKGMEREKKTARLLGWANIVIGILTFFGNWIYQKLIL